MLAAAMGARKSFVLVPADVAEPTRHIEAHYQKLLENGVSGCGSQARSERRPLAPEAAEASISGRGRLRM